jgi:hypothetical protein
MKLPNYTHKISESIIHKNLYLRYGKLIIFGILTNYIINEIIKKSNFDNYKTTNYIVYHLVTSISRIVINLSITRAEAFIYNFIFSLFSQVNSIYLGGLGGGSSEIINENSLLDKNSLFNELENLKHKIITKVTTIINKWLSIPNHSIDDLNKILEENKLIEKNEVNEENNFNLINQIIPVNITNSKYFIAYNKILNSLPYKLSAKLNNHIISIITELEQLNQQINQEYNTIITYTKIVSGIKQDQSDNIIDLNSLTTNSMDGYILNYKKLIKAKNNTSKQIKLILKNLLK